MTVKPKKMMIDYKTTKNPLLTCTSRTADLNFDYKERLENDYDLLEAFSESIILHSTQSFLKQ